MKEQSDIFGEGRRLAMILQHLGWSQRGKAREVFGVAQGTISFWVRQDRLPNVWWAKHCQHLKTAAPNINTDFIRDGNLPMEFPQGVVDERLVIDRLTTAAKNINEALLLIGSPLRYLENKKI